MGVKKVNQRVKKLVKSEKCYSNQLVQYTSHCRQRHLMMCAILRTKANYFNAGIYYRDWRFYLQNRKTITKLNREYTEIKKSS